MAFAGPVSAFAATQEKDSSFSTLYRFAIIPMFLFSGRSSPFRSCRRGSRSWPTARRCTTGSTLCRDLTLGQVSWADLGHAAYLVALLGAGDAAGRRTFAKKLVV